MNALKAYEAEVLDPSDIAAAYAFCANLVASHYENFPVASFLIKPSLRKHVAALYAFARIADDFADEAEHEGKRRERLLEWRLQLRQAARGAEQPRHPVFVAVRQTLRELD